MKILAKNRILAIILCMCIAVALLAGCSGNSSTSESSASSDISAQSTSVDETETPEVIEEVNSILAAMSLDELIEDSNLIVKAKLTGTSDAFQIESVGGGVTNFTDYYFEISETLRGQADESSTVSVRVRGGVVGDLETVNSVSYNLEEGCEYILFLYKPSYGGGFTAEGDYYYITGAQQGVYKLDAESDVYECDASEEAEQLTLSDFTAKVAEMNESVPPEDDKDYQNFISALDENLESGFITKDEYEETIKESEQYATVLG